MDDPNEQQEKRELTPMEKHPNYKKHLDELAKLDPKKRKRMEDYYRGFLMNSEDDNNMKDLIEKKAEEARDYFREKDRKTLEALPKEKQEEMLRHIQQFWQTDGISTEHQNTEQPVSNINPTESEKTPMEKSPNYQRIIDELAKLSQKERAEMEEHCRKYMMDDEEETPPTS